MILYVRGHLNVGNAENYEKIKTRGTAEMADTLEGVCYRPPNQDERQIMHSMNSSESHAILAGNHIYAGNRIQ